MSAQTLRGKSHRTGYGTFSLSESRESLLAMPSGENEDEVNVFVKREQRKLAMSSGENEDEVNVFIKSKDQRGLVHFGLARKHLYLYEHQTDGDT